VGRKILFVGPQIANPQILIPQSQIRKFLWQIRRFPWCPGQQITNQICKEKSSVSDPDPHWFASNIFFTDESIF
jgi:hypothetical protein